MRDPRLCGENYRRGWASECNRHIKVAGTCMSIKNDFILADSGYQENRGDSECARFWPVPANSMNINDSIYDANECHEDLGSERRPVPSRFEVINMTKWQAKSCPITVCQVRASWLGIFGRWRVTVSNDVPPRLDHRPRATEQPDVNTKAGPGAP